MSGAYEFPAGRKQCEAGSLTGIRVLDSLLTKLYDLRDMESPRPWRWTLAGQQRVAPCLLYKGLLDSRGLSG